MSEFKLDLSILGLDGAKEAYLKLHPQEPHTRDMYMRFDLHFDDLDSLELCCFISDFNRIVCLVDRKNLCIKITVPPIIHYLMVLIEDMLPYTTKYMRIT